MSHLRVSGGTVSLPPTRSVRRDRLRYQLVDDELAAAAFKLNEVINVIDMHAVGWHSYLLAVA